MVFEEMVRRLSALTALKREVDDLSQRIADLEWKAQNCEGRIRGLPGTSPEMAGRLREAAADVRKRMEARRLASMVELGRLYAFIDDIPDAQLRLILSARYIDGLSWQAIAFRIGETDEQVPRRLHNRLIQQKILENAKFDENDERSVL